MDDRIEDYQRIVEGAEIDLSFREDPMIQRVDEIGDIDEWKASYISNQAMNDL